MGRTLFWYIFKDLLKIFFMASGALAGIMSFGGLLRPLTQQGLDATQVGRMLVYFSWPMMAYSLPVAALFSATMVYGRLSADNELTACRAGGISHLSIAMPGFVLGAVVAGLSLFMLNFVVPEYTLKVEKVIYSNLAKLIQNRIERTHEIKFGDFDVFAQSARLPKPNEGTEPAAAARDQMVGADRSLAGVLDAAAGYVVVPDLPRSLAADGRMSGDGVVFEKGQPVGWAELEQLADGTAPATPAGGRIEIVVLKDAAAFERLKSGELVVADVRAAVPLTPGAAGAAQFDRGVLVFIEAPPARRAAAPASAAATTTAADAAAPGTEPGTPAVPPPAAAELPAAGPIPVAPPTAQRFKYRSLADSQRVVLEGVSIVTYNRAERPNKPANGDARKGTAADKNDAGDSDDKPAKGDKGDKSDNKPEKTPREFLLADTATVEIREREDDQVDLLIGLEKGTKFPREFAGGSQLGIGTTQFGPIEMPSPIKEDTKFMKIGELRRLYDNPEKSRRIKGMVADYVRHDQIRQYLDKHVLWALNQPGVRRFTFDDARGPVTIVLSDDATRTVRDEAGKERKEPVIAQPTGPWAEELVAGGDESGAVTFKRDGESPTYQLAREVRIRFRPDAAKHMMHATIELIGRSPVGGKAVSGNYSDLVSVPMPRDVVSLESRKTSHYLNKPEGISATERQRLRREVTVINNAILAEVHGRLSFAVSCFILVLVGSALGMMFRSGNFLTAFAFSFVPALLCITMIVSGQQTCHAVPWHADQHNPIGLGVMLIWSGNAINLALAVGLLWRLQRQ